MINDTVFIVNITEHRNYLEQTHMEYKTYVAKFSTEGLLRLLRMNYKNSGAFIYGIGVKR